MLKKKTKKVIQSSKLEQLFKSIKLVSTKRMRDKYVMFFGLVKSNNFKNLQQYLLNEEIDVNVQDDDSGDTALIISSRNGNFEMVGLFLKMGANIYIKNNLNKTPLMIAQEKRNQANDDETRRKYTRIVQLINFSGKNIQKNIRIDNGKRLIDSVKNGNLNDVKYLLTLPNDWITINFKDENGKTALIHAAKLGAAEIVKILVSKKSRLNVNLRDKQGNTALMYAVARGSLPIVKMLFEQTNIDVSLKNGDNKTVLQLIEEKIIFSPQSKDYGAILLLIKNKLGQNNYKGLKRRKKALIKPFRLK